MTFSYCYNPVTTGPGKKKRGSDDDGEDMEGFPFMDAMKKKPYQTFEQTFTAQHVHFYISKAVGAPDEYTEMIYRMTVSGPQDVIYLHLNTPGGQLDTGVQIINAMQNSQAKIVTILESTAYSLGTLIFLSGDEMIVNENCLMMFHNFNGGLMGKGNEMVSELEASVKWFAALAKEIYVPFLSEEEFDRIVRGEDMWMQTAEIRSRLEAMQGPDEEEQRAAAIAELEALQVELKKAEKAERAAQRAAAKKVPVKKAPAKKVPAKKTRVKAEHVVA